MINTLSKLPFWNSLNENQKQYIEQNSVIRHYEKGTTIFSCGASCLGLTYIINGSIRVYINSEEGREITLFRLKENSTCVLSASCVINQISFDTQMETEQDCDILIVNSKAFKHITKENIYVKCFMYELMTKRFSSVMWTMQQILFSKFDKRLATFLISESERTKSNEIHMTQEDIAKQVNSAREVVTRMLKRFAADGMIEIKRGYIIIKNINDLKEIENSN